MRSAPGCLIRRIRRPDGPRRSYRRHHDDLRPSPAPPGTSLRARHHRGRRDRASTTRRRVAGGTSRSSFCHDPDTGLRAVIALYSTALGPGARRHPVPPVRRRTTRPSPTCSTSPAAMAYKNALAGLDHGGGKAVIIGDPRRDKTRGLLRAYGRFVAVARRPLRHGVRRRHLRRGHGRRRAGVPLGRPGASRRTAAPATRRCSPPSACSRACAPAAQRPLGRRRRCAAASSGIAGVGKVGRHLVEHLLERRRRGRGHRRRRRTPSRGSLAAHPGVDVPSRRPRRWSASRWTCTRRARSAARSTAEVVGRAARRARLRRGQQPARRTRASPKLLADRGILYAPDYCVNAGGVIQVADELHGFTSSAPGPRTERIYDTTLAVLARPPARGRAARRGGGPARRAADARRRPLVRIHLRLTRGEPAGASTVRRRGRHRPAGRRSAGMPRAPDVVPLVARRDG